MRPTTSTLLRLPRLPRITLTIQLPRPFVPPFSSALASSSELWRSPQPSLAGFDALEETEAAEEHESEVMQWDGMLNAVPKKKVSHSRKAMRAANKGLKDRVDLVHCAGCGSPKVAHHICATCYGEIHRTQKMARRAAELKAQEAALEQQAAQITAQQEQSAAEGQRHAALESAKTA